MCFLILAVSTNCVFSSVSGRWFQVPQSISLTYPIDNSEINIRAGGQLFPVGKKSVCTSVTDLADSLESEKENLQNAAIEYKTGEFKSYQSHENIEKLDQKNSNFDSEAKKVANEDLLKAIDHTLIKFGMNDNGMYDPNMNDQRTTATVDNLINKTCEMERKLSKDEGRKDLKVEPEVSPGLFEQLAVSKGTNTSFPLRKSKSAPNPFKNARMKVAGGKWQVCLHGVWWPSLVSSLFCTVAALIEDNKKKKS